MKVEENSKEIETKLKKYGKMDSQTILKELGTSIEGLSCVEIEEKQDEYGKNIIDVKNNKTVIGRLKEAFITCATKRTNIGIYRLIMKKHSDNFRESAIQDIIKILKKENVDIIIYEPMLKVNKFDECDVINNFKDFCEKADIILANRWENELTDIKNKVYTRYIYYKDL